MLYDVDGSYVITSTLYMTVMAAELVRDAKSESEQEPERLRYLSFKVPLKPLNIKKLMRRLRKKNQH